MSPLSMSARELRLRQEAYRIIIAVVPYIERGETMHVRAESQAHAKALYATIRSIMYESRMEIESASS